MTQPERDCEVDIICSGRQAHKTRQMGVVSWSSEAPGWMIVTILLQRTVLTPPGEDDYDVTFNILSAEPLECRVCGKVVDLSEDIWRQRIVMAWDRRGNSRATLDVSEF